MERREKKDIVSNNLENMAELQKEPGSIFYVEEDSEKYSKVLPGPLQISNMKIEPESRVNVEEEREIVEGKPGKVLEAQKPVQQGRETIIAGVIWVLTIAFIIKRIKSKK